MLRATIRHTRSAWYLRQGGSWDIESLDEALAAGGGSLVDGDRHLSPVAIEDRVSRLAGGLRAMGAGRGRVVAWQLPNGCDAHLLCRACWRLGAVAAPIHHAAGAADVEAVLAQLPDHVLIDDPGRLTGEAIPMSASVARPADLAAVLFTAGSTGRPKAVLHTQRGLLAKAKTMVSVHGLGRQDAILMPAPMAHISGLLNGVLVPGVAGMKTVWMARWDPSRAVHLIEAERVSFMVGPPTFFVGLMASDEFTPEKVRSLQLVSSGGTGVTASFVDRASAELGCRVKRTYGSTEAPSVTTSGQDDPPWRGLQTDGRPTGEAEVRVCDRMTGRPVGPGETGEVQVRGPELFVGYADPQLTGQAFARGGWFKTGDLGRLDSDGWLTISGRLKDVIIRGGENIAAADVEEHLEAHPGVRQAAVVGYPDDRLGERVCAFVVTTEPFDLDACQQWFAARGVTRFKWPERVVSVDALPLLAAGKVDRAALRRRLK
jgi:cyclohexanecarboxylate-CoA ligase